MALDDPYDFDDSIMQVRSYKEFKMEKIDKDNLNEIEKNLLENKITSSNRNEILTYLSRMLRKINEIKKQEYHYEGEHNDNLNEYLKRIILLKEKIEQIK
jgi:hypothetical protein